MMRRTRLAGGQEILLTDTVGFVQRLPATLVVAFHATLEEVAEADLCGHKPTNHSGQFAAFRKSGSKSLRARGCGTQPATLLSASITVALKLDSTSLL